tara:strand:- start:140 stop:982 length:843 start_codon:yes stop_codon:yes gene_type:complete
MTRRNLKTTVPTHTVLEGGGFPVRRPAAMGSLMSPFLLLDEMGPVHWDPCSAIGAPDHPHRGFETVTYMLQGAMQHRDSAGNKGDLNPGDVQWMTAGRGIIHSELPQDDFYETGGTSHGFQIWVNLPAKDKMMEPRYQDIPAANIPSVRSEDGKVWANIIAGQTMGVEAVIDTVIPITYIHMKMEHGGEHVQQIDQGLNGMIYVFGGTVYLNGRPVQDGQLGLMTDGDEVLLEARDGDAEFLILAGPELNEPIARYGPFVMNTREEIHQAIQDFQNGTLA